MLLGSAMTTLIIPVYTVNEELVKMTDKCLTSIFRTTPPNVELIVVDDGSPIPYKTNVGKLITRTENGGYSKACNSALKEAKGDILIIGNNDLIFHENWLNELLFPLNVGYDVATCWSSDQKEKKIEDRIQSGANFGCLLAIIRKVYETIGGFDEQFHGYFTDDDYHRRVIEAGFRIGKNCNMVIEHEAKATYSTVDPDDYEYEKARVLFDNKWNIYAN